MTFAKQYCTCMHQRDICQEAHVCKAEGAVIGYTLYALTVSTLRSSMCTIAVETLMVGGVNTMVLTEV